MSSAPTDCRVPEGRTPDPSDKLDAKADGQFQQVNRRAGYGDDRLDRIIATARKGWTLAAGEGLVLVQEIDRLRQEFDIATSMLGGKSRIINGLQDEIDRLRQENETLHSRVLSGSLEDRSAIHQLQDLNLRHQEVNDRLRSILAALREPSEAVLKAAFVAVVDFNGDLRDGITAAVEAAEREASV